MFHVDQIYISRLSSKLERFAKKRDHLFNCRCPLCGDSQKKTYKARGYIYIRKNNYNYVCHNCGASMSLASFIKIVDPNLHKEYVFEKWKSGQTGSRKNVKEPEFTFEKPVFKKKVCDFDHAIKISDLPENHSARVYCERRMIPRLDLLYYTNDFHKLVNSVTTGYEKLLKEERIIIPSFDKECNLIALQGRALGNSEMRYITIKVDDDAPKIFGMERVDNDKTVYVVEGPIDSLFIENSVAMMGSDVDISVFDAYDDVVFVMDNEPRNKQIVDRMQQIISAKKRVVIWPEKIKEKDINDVIMSGIDSSELMSIISKNTFEGLTAKLEFSTWKKC